MRILKWLEGRLFGSRMICVGHGTARDGNAVILHIGRKFVCLSPEGARKVADQLNTWADHAETSGHAIQSMKWIIKFTTKDAVEKAAEEWVATSLQNSADALSSKERA